nr:protein PRRC2C isoform X3 [Hydra vulgaris]
MSQTSSNKGKELPGKKYNTINLNQTYKSKVEKTGSGVQGVRHGMQSLGKIGQSRRVLQPASLPSLKKENSGNDPRVNLVPSTGSQGWVKKDGQNVLDGAPLGVLDSTKTTVAKNTTNNQEISLRPHAGVVPGTRIIPGGMAEDTQKPSWVSKVQPQPQGATKYFQREFPTLGGDSEKDIAVGSHAENLEQGANHLVMAHQAFISNGQKWMEGANSAMMVPANFPQFKGDPSQMFASQRQCYPFAMPMYPGDMHNYPLHPMYMSYGPGGKIPMSLYRMPKTVSGVNPQTDQSFVNKDSDDNGWAGAQEEVDYNAKLKFDESDDSDEDVSKKKKENIQKSDIDDSKKEKSVKSPPEAWSENQNFPAHVHMQPYNHQHWSRMPYSFDPRTPMPYFFIPQYPYPVVMPTPSEQSDRNTENISKEAEPLTETPTAKPDDLKEADRKAKLRKIEEDIKKREAEKKNTEVDGKKVFSNEADDVVNVGMHKRSDSETSDSSRPIRDIPPRFQRQISAQKTISTLNSDGNTNDTNDSHFRIMKRKESYKSDDESCKENIVKKIDSFELIDSDKISQDEKQTVSSLNQEVLKSDQKTLPEVIDKSQKAAVSSTVYNNDVVQKNSDKEKRGLKELTDFKAEIKNQDQIKTESALDKNIDVRFDSERFADLKLTKGHVKKKLMKEKGDVLPTTELLEREPTRAPAWNKVVSQEANQSSGVKKTLIEIQKEEEELSKKAIESKLLDKCESTIENIKAQERSSPTENKFRSDTYQNKPFSKSDKYQNDRRSKFDDDSKRRYNRYDRDHKKTEFSSQNESYLDHPRENYRNRSENAHKGNLTEEKESSLKEYESRHEGKRDYSRYNGRDYVKKDYDVAKRDRGEYDRYKRDRVGDQDRYKKDKVEGDQDKSKKDRGDGEQDRYKKDKVEGDQDKSKKDRGDGEQDRYKKDKGDGEQDRYKKDKVEGGQERHKKDRGDGVQDRYKKDRGDGEYDRYKVREDNEYSRYKKDRTDKEHDRYKKDRGDIESTRYKKDKGDVEYFRVRKDREVEYENRYRKDKGEYDRYKKDKVGGELERPKLDKGDPEYNTKYKKDRGEYDKFKKDRVDSKRDEKIDKYSEKLQAKLASTELQSDSVETNQETLSEKPVNKTNELDNAKLVAKKDVENETSRRARDYSNRNYDRRKEYNSDYHKQEKPGSRRNERKDFDKDLSKKYSGKSSLEDENKISNKDSAIVFKDVKSENIEDVEKYLTKKEDIKIALGPKDSDVVNKDASGKEVNGNILLPQKSSKYNKSKTDSSHNYLDSKEVHEAGHWRSRQSYTQDSFTHSKKSISDKVKLSQEDEELITGEEESSLKIKKAIKKSHQKSWEQDRPPRFQQKYENEDRDVSRWRGARGSHRGRTNRGRGRVAANSWSSNTEVKLNQEKVSKDISQDIQEVSINDSVEVANNEAVVEQRRPQSNRDRGYGRDRGRGRGSYKGNGSNSTSGPRSDKSDSFLVNRQQLGNNLTSSNTANPQTAADKMDSRQLGENLLTKKNVSNLEDISANSPSKKNKPVEKKRDIRKEFDLSNIASVVCIDDMKCFDSISQKSTDDDGFVKVISKKHQKKLRDKCREEEKQKFLLEQKKEASKAQKLARKEKVTTKKTSTQISETTTLIREQIPISTHVPSLPTTTVTQVSQPATSNLQDMMGVWEPAQSLMRTSQSNSLSEQISSSVSVSSNAWQRPLTLTSSLLPDPRAVGTGKPSSAPGVIKVTVMHSQATPEAASPIITPPQLAPILSGNSVSVISDLSNSNANIKREFSKNKSFEGKQQSSQNTHETQVISDVKKLKLNQKKEPKSLSKKYLAERPPRFQANAKRVNDERTRKFSEPRKEKYSGKRDDKSRLSDRSQKGERFSREIKPQKSIEQPVAINNDEVFLNENISVEMQTKSLLSEEEKVVGSKKPSIKTQSSVGSYKSDVFDEPAKDVSLQFQASQDNIVKSLCKEPEKNINKTPQSVVKPITSDEEQSLETRSLPGSPSLAVKIPEPTLCGPSSDPGKVSDPNIKKFASSIAQEMNEMNRKIFDAKKAWDETPTARSDSASKVKTVSVVSSSSVAESVPALTEGLPTTKFEQLSTVSITEVKSTEEKIAQNFPTKRTDQQNICKVKPQQQIPSEDNRSYISANIPQVSNLSSQPNRGRYVFNVERPVQTNIYESIYGDQLRAQGNQLAYSRPGQVHSIDQVVPPMSQRPEMVLSSLPVANPNTHFYGMDASIQNSQNALLTWQMVSTTNVQPTKPLHYPTQHHQGSLFTSPVISTSPLVMSYRSGYSPQRSTASIQHQALMQHNQTAVMSPQEVGLNITDPYVGRLVGVLQPQPSQSQTRRDQFQGVLPSQPHINTNAMTLLLDPSNPQNHLSQQQRSDLMKHVHAKPFEPTSQTPPLMQSSSLLNRHHSATPMQQQVISSVFSQPTAHQQTQQKYSQPIIQRQPNHHQVNPLVAPVRPRAIHGQSSGTSPPLRTLSNHQEQVMNNHQNFVYQNTLGLGHPRGSVMQSVHVTHPMSNQYLGNYLQQQYQPNIQSRPNFNLPQNKPLGPIQRPLQISPSNFSSAKQCSSNEEFKKIQRQKMLEDTKKYFQNDGNTPSQNTSVVLASEEPSSTSQTTLSEHDKLTTDKPKDKRFDVKKTGRSGEHTRGNRNQRPKSNLSTNTLPLGKPYDLASKRSTSKV